MRRFSKFFGIAAALLCAVPAAAQDTPGDASPDKPPLALMGTVPLYWGEAAGFEAILQGEGEAHWARAVLEDDWQLAPLDYLSEDALAGHSHLLLAQPRGLSPEENVALDAWVRAGGKLLLFADPLITAHSPYGFGDRRRTQDTVLLSPILTHWGLDLLFDDDAGGARTVSFGGTGLPVDMAGHFVLRDNAGEHCRLASEAVIARCDLGEGSVVAVADAAVLDMDEPSANAEGAFRLLVAAAMGTARESASKSDELQQIAPEIAGFEANAVDAEGAE